MPIPCPPVSNSPTAKPQPSLSWRSVWLISPNGRERRLLWPCRFPATGTRPTQRSRRPSWFLIQAYLTTKQNDRTLLISPIHLVNPYGVGSGAFFHYA